MGLEHIGWGGWCIFPMIMCIIMMFGVSRIFGRGDGFKPPWSLDSDRHHSEITGSQTSMEILKKRYAKGEIAKEELEQMKRELLT